MANPNIQMPDMQVLRHLAKDNLVHLLESLPDKKDLIIDPVLMRPLDRIAGAQLLKSHGVNKIYKLESNRIDTECTGRMYLVQPTIENAKLIADQIKADKKFEKRKRYKILFTPRRLFICDLILEQEGVYEDVSIEEFKLGLIPLDDDIFSLEIPEFFRSFYLDGDQTWVHTIATSIVNIQTVFGTIPHKYGTGKCSKMVFDMITTIQSLQNQPKAPIKNEIGHLFLIDRDIDMVTPLCTQTTYEGLVDETFGINCGFCEFGPEITGGKNAKLLLTSDDLLFEEIRNRHISNVFGFLSDTAKSIQQGYTKGREIKSIGDMKNFVQTELKDLKQQYKSLTIHIGACEQILKQTSKQVNFQEQLQTEHSILEGSAMKDNYTYLEETIDRQSTPNKALRMMCLLSLTQNGLPTKEFRTLQTHYMHSNGFDHILTFNNLNKLGMFTEQPSVDVSKMSASDLKSKVAEKALKRSAFRTICKRLNLIPKVGEVNLRNPEDMSFVLSGAYTPLSCKIVEQYLNRTAWAGLEDVKKLLPNALFDEHRGLSVKGHIHSSQTHEAASERVAIVFFLGGCTFAEIAALRLLGRLKGYKFIFATTAITNGDKLMDSIRLK